MAQATRYHLAPHGPDVCRADPLKDKARGCPFGGASGNENHFATMAEAEQAYEAQMESEGNGLVATAATTGASAGPNSLQGALNRVFRTHFDDMVSDSYYGLSRASDGGFVADSTEGLERFRADFMAKTGDEIDPVANLGPKPYSGVIQKLSIPELNIEIRNQNYERDVQEIGELLAFRESRRSMSRV